MKTNTMNACDTNKAKQFMKSKKGKAIGLLTVLAAIGTAATLILRAKRAR
jgi:hypothetical protein